MTKPANRNRGELALSEAGEGIFLRLTVDAMERLETEYGENYINTILQKTNAVSPKAIKTLLSCMVEGHDVDFTKEPWKSIPWGMNWADLSVRISDAIMIAIHGRTVAEHTEYMKQEAKKRIAKDWEDASNAENPLEKAALLSQMSAILGLQQGSNQNH